jgi:hypothetical protein
MKYRKKFFTTLAHLTLSGKEIFGRRFIGDVCVCSHVAKRINATGNAIDCAPNQAATLSRIGFACAGNDSIAL